MGKVKSEYEKRLDEFYDLDDEPNDYFKRKLEDDRAFRRVWDTMVNDPNEVEKLKELFGTEFEHINNHFLKIKNTQ